MENMKKCKFDIVAFLAVFILIAFIGCMCVAIAFGIKQQKNLLNVAYADYVPIEVNDVVSQFYYNVDFDPRTIIVNLNRSNAVQVDSLYEYTFIGGTILGSTPVGLKMYVLYAGDTFEGFTSSTDECFILGFIDQNAPLYDSAGMYGSVFGWNSSEISTDNGLIQQYNVTITDLQYQDYFRYFISKNSDFYNPDSGGDYNSGYSDGYHVGYQDGFQDGFNSVDLETLLSVQNFQLLDNFSFNSNGQASGSSVSLDNDNFSTNFNFDNKNFALDKWYAGQSAVLSNYQEIAQFWHTYSSDTSYYFGVKYSNSQLFGDILVRFPFKYNNDEFDLMLVFVDTVNGETIYIDSRDTVHWYWGDNVGTVSGYSSGSYSIYNCTVRYYCSDPCDLYFVQRGLLPAYNSTDVNLLMHRALWLPIDCGWSAIYSTGFNTALNDYDAGFEQGKLASERANAQAVSNARAAGYEEGRRDALADSNDYTFIGLLGAVFDAPIKSFQGLLNFDVLGVNMQSFVLALLSLSVIIIIIKIALGGK